MRSRSQNGARYFCWVLFLASGFLPACSSGSKNPAADLLEPEFRIRQVGGQAFAARHVTGPITVNFQVEIINKSAEPLKVDRIQVESMGAGAYTLPSLTRNIGREIPPNHIEVFELWAPAVAEATIMGANGPVTLRSVVYYTSAVGKFQKVYVQQVNDPTRRRPPAQ